MAAPAGEIAPLITNVLAPTVMVSYCGLLILGLQNRYSNVVNRMRGLNHERFELAAVEELSTYEAERFTIVSEQVKRLLMRCRLIRDSIIWISCAVIFFLLAAILSLISAWQQTDFNIFIIASFGLGMGLTVLAMLLATIDIFYSYRILSIETQAKSQSSLAAILGSLFGKK
jgi:hypothetical protein